MVGVLSGARRYAHSGLSPGLGLSLLPIRHFVLVNRWCRRTPEFSVLERVVYLVVCRADIGYVDRHLHMLCRFAST
jgi:hypothetical protein